MVILMYSSIYMANAYVSKYYNDMLDLNAYEKLMNSSKEDFSLILHEHKQDEVIKYMQSQVSIDTWYNKQVQELKKELQEFQAEWIIEVLSKREQLIELNVTQDFDIHILKFYNSLLSNEISSVQEYARLYIDRWFLIALFQQVTLDDSYYEFANVNIPKQTMIELFESKIERNHYLKSIYEDLITDGDTAKFEHSFDSYVSKQMYEYIMDIQNENALFSYAFFRYQEFKNIRMIVKAKLYYIDPLKQRQLLRFHYG